MANTSSLGRQATVHAPPCLCAFLACMLANSFIVMSRSTQSGEGKRQLRLRYVLPQVVDGMDTVGKIEEVRGKHSAHGITQPSMLVHRTPVRHPTYTFHDIQMHVLS